VDEEARNREFAAREHLRFRLLSDSRELAAELGILEEIEGYGSLAARVTYLLDPDGTVLRFWRVGPGEAVDRHPDEVLAAARALASVPAGGD
jgi:peroxiredoxin